MNQCSRTATNGEVVAKVLRLLGITVAVVSLFLTRTPLAHAADHRDNPLVAGIPEGDITDFYVFLDPNDPTKLVLSMNVNGFTAPAERGSLRFSDHFLYQFKIDNDNDAIEEKVIQVTFSQADVTADSPQMINVFGPRTPKITGSLSKMPTGTPDLTGPVGKTTTQGDLKVFAGTLDDPFVADLGQLFRILTKEQDVFRGFTSPALGALRGRSLHSDGTSGTDAFGGFDVSSIQVELPASMVRGLTSAINVWSTVSRPLTETETKQFNDKDSKTFIQFERNGQPLANTVYMPAAMKIAFKRGVPQDDIKNFGAMVPDALTTTDNDGTGNTISGRAALLHAIGVDALPNGAPLLLPSNFANADVNLARKVVLPDYARIDLDILPPDDLQIGVFGKNNTLGYANGRRPGDDVVDIILRLGRQLFDVKFPDGSGVPGSGPKGSRNALDCSVLPQCPDRRVLAVLQGTDFIKPDSQVPDISTNGNDRPFNTSFPFFASPHPLPGDPGTVGYPPQQ